MGLALGIDTSNYKTSIALIDKDNNIIYDDRRLLRVPEGSKGLRQQEAFFQHVKRLPNMIGIMLDNIREMNESIEIVSVSDKPRNVEGSYMPCFEAGVSIAKTISSSYNVPLVKYSHQEGHIAAGRIFTPLNNEEEFIAFHFSGGTTEALRVHQRKKEPSVIEIVGGSKDISFGQLIDRIGVSLGLPFPAGEELDYGALRCSSGKTVFNSNGNKLRGVKGFNFDSTNVLKDLSIDTSKFKIKCNDSYINLSGVETSVLRYIESLDLKDGSSHSIKDEIALALMTEISKGILSLTKNISSDTGIKNFLFVGGVSASSYIRSFIEKEVGELGLNISFASPELSSDNAIGTAILGGESIWL